MVALPSGHVPRSRAVADPPPDRGPADRPYDALGTVARRRRPPRVVAVGVTGAAVVALVSALLLGGGAPPVVPAGLADPGPVVGWALRLARLADVLLAALTVGSLLATAWLAPDDDGLRVLRHAAAGRLATAWAAVGAVGYGLVLCDLDGVPVLQLSATRLATGWTTLPAAAQLVQVLLAGCVVVAARRPGPTRGRSRSLLVLAVATALPVPLAGHAGSAGDQGLAVGGLAVHVVAALLWTGGLAALVGMRHRSTSLPQAVTRFSALALGCYVALVGSGLVAATAAMSVTGESWRSTFTGGYAAVLAAKAVTVSLLGALGARQRTRARPDLVAGRSAAFLRLALAELVLMAAAVGLAVALARTPLPVEPVGTHADALGAPGPPTWLAWRPDAVVLAVVATAAAAYVGGVRRLRADGGSWPRWRSACFVGGTALAALASCSPLGVYAPLLLSAQLLQLVLLLLAVPLLLLLGRPQELRHAVLGAGRGAGVPRRATDPRGTSGRGVVATCLLLVGVLWTPVLPLVLGSGWWHLVVAVVAVSCGILVLRPLVAGDAVRASAAAWLVVLALALAAAGARLLTDDGLVASAWFLELRLGWVDPLADQRRAGAVLVLAAAACVAGAFGTILHDRGSRVRSAVVGDRAPTAGEPQPHDHPAA